MKVADLATSLIVEGRRSKKLESSSKNYRRTAIQIAQLGLVWNQHFRDCASLTMIVVMEKVRRRHLAWKACHHANAIL